MNESSKLVLTIGQNASRLIVLYYSNLPEMVKLASRKVCRKQEFYPRNISLTQVLSPEVHALLEVSLRETTRRLSQLPHPIVLRLMPMVLMRQELRLRGIVGGIQREPFIKDFVQEASLEVLDDVGNQRRMPLI